MATVFDLSKNEMVKIGTNFEAPLISVVMPVFNGERFLREAVDSILNQTFTNFEFIIIDDGSTDQTAMILNSYLDPRIIRITHSSNLGVARSLNDGIALTRGKYIARMDADDISLPDRFEKQITYIENHSGIGAIGSNVYEIDEDGDLLRIIQNPSSFSLILWKLCFSNPIRHPTTIIRTSVLKAIGGYRDYKASEDYDLWQRLSEITQIENLPDILVYYRIHGKNVSVLPNKNRSTERKDIRQRAINYILEGEVEINWRKYWGDPFYSSLIVFRLNKALRGQIKSPEFEIIIKEASEIIYKKLMAIRVNNPVSKIKLLALIFLLSPKQAIRICQRKILKFDPSAIT